MHEDYIRRREIGGKSMKFKDASDEAKQLGNFLRICSRIIAFEILHDIQIGLIQLL